MFKSNDTKLYQIKELSTKLEIETTQLKRWFADIPANENAYGYEVINVVLFSARTSEDVMANIFSLNELEEACVMCGYSFTNKDIKSIYHLLCVQVVYCPVRYVRSAFKKASYLSDIYDDGDVLVKSVDKLREALNSIIISYRNSISERENQDQIIINKATGIKSLIISLGDKLDKDLEAGYNEAFDLEAYKISNAINNLRVALHLPLLDH